MTDRASQIMQFNLHRVTQYETATGAGGNRTAIEGGNAIDVSITEGNGAPITDAAMPAGGAGLTGWLSSLFVQTGANPPAATGLTDVPPASGKGVLGWLSGLYNQNGSNPPAATGLTDVPPASGRGVLGWLSGLYNVMKAPQKVYKATLTEVSSAASPFNIPAGATEVSVANTGTTNASIKSADMAAAVNLYPISDGGLAVTWRAPDGGTLPAITVTVPAGATVQVSVVN
jgi:hypothetical protein